MSESPASDDSMTPYQQGRAAMVVGDVTQALAFFSQAANDGEDSADFNHDYAMLYAGCWDFEAAQDRLERSLLKRPDDPRLLNNLGNVLQALLRPDQALEVYLKAEKISPMSPETAFNVGNLLEKKGEYAKAVRRYDRIVKGHPGLAIAHLHLAKGLLAVGKPAPALASVNRCLIKTPDQQEAIALKAILLRELGRDKAARDIFDYSRFIRSFELPTPAGYDCLEAFHRELVDHLETHASNRSDPFGTATHNGRHSKNILNDPVRPAAILKEWLQSIFRQYVEELPVDPNHPFLRQSFPNCRISAEAQLLDPSGFLSTHIHDAGRVSGAYYVSLPAAVVSGNERAGWLEFGNLPDGTGNTVAPEIFAVQPKTGMAVLFPSYFYHGTRPFVSNSRRVSLGIDLIPLEAGKSGR